MANLTLAFLRPPSDDRCMNRLTACASKHGICHVELVFDGGLAFSIYEDRSLFLRQRSMANPGYELVLLAVSQKEYKAALQFWKDQVFDAVSSIQVYQYVRTPSLRMDPLDLC